MYPGVPERYANTHADIHKHEYPYAYACTETHTETDKQTCSDPISVASLAAQNPGITATRFSAAGNGARRSISRKQRPSPWRVGGVGVQLLWHNADPASLSRRMDGVETDRALRCNQGVPALYIFPTRGEPRDTAPARQKAQAASRVGRARQEYAMHSVDLNVPDVQRSR